MASTDASDTGVLLRLDPDVGEGGGGTTTLSADIGPHGFTDGAAAQDVYSGTLSFTDPVLTDQHTAKAALAKVVWSARRGDLPEGLDRLLASAMTTSLTDSTGSGAGKVGFRFSLADSATSFLAAGETLTVTYEVILRDNHGRSTSRPVTFVITGTNDAPVITSARINGGDAGHGGQGESGDGGRGHAAVSGELTFADPNVDDTHTTSAILLSATSSGAALTAAQMSDLAAALKAQLGGREGDGHAEAARWGFYLPASLATLPAGQTVLVQYNVNVADNHGGKASQLVSLLLTGGDKATTVLAGVASGEIIEHAGVATDTASGVLDLSGGEGHDPASFSTSVAFTSWSGGKTIPAAALAALNTALTESIAAPPPHVGEGGDGGEGDGAPAATWTFSAPAQNFDFLAQGETLTVAYKVTQTGRDHDGAARLVTIVITGASASVAVHDSGVTEDLNVNGAGNLTDVVSISAVGASGAATGFTVSGAAGNLGAISPGAGSGNASVTYTVSNAAIYATHLGFGEWTKDTFTVTTVNHTTQTFTETINGSIHAPTVTATAAQPTLAPGHSTRLNIAASDHDDNAHLTYQVTGVPTGATLTSAANPGGITFNAQTNTYAIAAAALGDLTFTAASAGPVTLHVTVTNTETAGSASATATASQDIAITVQSSGPIIGPSGLPGTPPLGVDSHGVPLPFDPSHHNSAFISSNANGDIVGVIDGSLPFQYHRDTGAFTWIDGGDPNSFGGAPFAINEAGVIAGNFAFQASGYSTMPFLVNGGSLTFYGNGFYQLTAVSSDGVGAGTTGLDPWIGSPDGNSFPFFLFGNGTLANVNRVGTAAKVGPHGDWMSGYSANGSNPYQGWVFTSSHTMNWVFENGSFANINDPSAKPGQTYSLLFDTSGDVAGSYLDASNVRHAFIYANGAYHNFDAPAGGSLIQDWSGGITGIGPGGFAAGVYKGADGHQHGFLYNANTNTLTSFDAPNGGDIREFDYSYWGNTIGTMAISPDGSQVAGMYNDASGHEHGFVFRNGAVTTLDIAGWDIVQPYAIDSHGNILGEVSMAGVYAYGIGQIFVHGPI